MRICKEGEVEDEIWAGKKVRIRRISVRARKVSSTVCGGRGEKVKTRQEKKKNMVGVSEPRGGG